MRMDTMDTCEGGAGSGTRTTRYVTDCRRDCNGLATLKARSISCPCTVTRSMAKRESLVSSWSLIERTSHKAAPMIDQTLFHYQLESSRTSATIYIGGDACCHRHIESVRPRVARSNAGARIPLTSAGAR
jgi:hypothetical protein